ncbi:MAG: DUF4835 family protein [Bacteroidota bacterium]
MKHYLFISGLFFFLFLGLLSHNGQAQELDCQVNVSASQVQTSNRDRFDELQEAIKEFMNDRKWTDSKFNTEERIECSILIILKEEVSTDKFQATIQVQSRRPVYNTSYNTPLFNFKDDKFTFEYERYQNLNFDVNSFQSNLTSVLAYYAYLIIGLDFDTFSSLGGTDFYQNAQTIVNNAQNSDYKGWKSFEDKQNRYWIVEDLLNGSLEPLREGYYQYHRHGLDKMAEEEQEARKNILQSLEEFEKAKDQKSFLYILEVLMNTKKDELVNIFRKAPSTMQTKAIDKLKKVDPAHSGDYDKISQK